MSAAVVEAADAVVAALNAAGLSPYFEARRAYAPKVDLRELAALAVTVVPDALATGTRTLDARPDLDWDLRIWIQKRVETDAERDALLDLAEEVVILFSAWRKARTRRVLAIEARPAIAAGKSDSTGVFETVVTLTVRTTRNP
jgi:hypothetical protein